MTEKTIIAYKGFEKDFTCQGFQYEVGKEYEEKDEINCCNNGFHACKVPLDVFKYYSPTDKNGNLRKFAVVEQSGKIEEDENKIASSKIKINKELSIMDLVKCHVDYVKENTEAIDQNTGHRSASTSTGYYSASTNTGDCSASTSTGYRSKAEVEKENSTAFAFGFQSRARAKNGWIIIVDWRLDDNGNRYINNIHTAKVGGNILETEIKSNVWYWFEDGKLMSEVER